MDARFSATPLTPTLSLQLADRIGAAIVAEQFAPGERLKETELAQAFGVSRATVREALRLLESRGLVRILPQRGAQVTQLSRKELEDFFEIRAVLLGLGSRRAALARSDDDVLRLEAGLSALEAHLGTLDEYTRLSAALVDEMMRISGSVALTAYIEEFAQRIGRYVRLGLTTARRRQRSLETWRQLIEAVAHRNGDAAESTHRMLALENRDAALAELARRDGLIPAASAPNG